MPPGVTGPLPDTIGAYIVREKIGSGGMATIYRVYNPADKGEYALKVMAVHLASEENLRRRFEREARTLIKLRHPHILPVYDCGEDEGVPYIVMKLLDGRTLADLLDDGPLPVPQVSRLAHQIASALDYAHAEGIIHRDVKPSNILLDANNQPYLSDFGVAYVDDANTRLTLSGGFIGTVSYASPEQCRGDPVGPSSDIYSLAVMVFQMITGQLPFTGPSSFMIIKMHMSEAPPNPLSINPSLPVELYAVLAKALAKLPEYRYPSAMRLSEALDEALGLDPAGATPAGDRWLYDDEPPQPDTTDFIPPALEPAPGPPPPVTDDSAARPGTEPDDLFADIDIEEEPIDPFEDIEAISELFAEDRFTPPEDFPTPESVLQNDPQAFSLPPETSGIQPIGSPLPGHIRRSARWERWGVYASIVISLMALGIVAIVAVSELRSSGLDLDATYSSAALGITFDYPSGWHIDTASTSVLFAAPTTAVVLADRPVPASGPYDNASLVITVQRLDPVTVYSVPSGCRDRIPGGPSPTFDCMARNNYLTPVHQPFDRSGADGVKLPGTLPPTTAAWPIILLPGSSTDWLAVIIIHWDDYEDARAVLDAVAASARPT
ncbi:MAG: serine/threonine protein kinase [Anaerolineae bacterium]|nr:serine/threonine protein kinase [Anaerolineae bacterium]